VQHANLEALADETGGFAAVNVNNLASTFDRIRQDNSTYYVLGYYPTNEKRDGKVRTLQVKTRSGLLVRARKNYVAPRGKAPASTPPDAKDAIPTVLRDALASPLPVTGLRLTAFAAPFAGTPPNAAITLVVQFDGRDLTFTEAGGTFNGNLDLSVVALDGLGKTTGTVHRPVSLPLKPESYKLVGQYGMRVVSRLDLPPGRYQLRIGATDKASQRTGSVHYDLDVPDFAKHPLSMSGLLLTSSTAGIVPTAGGSAIDDLRKTLPGPPTVARQFKAGEELALMAEIYDTQAATPHVIDIVATLRSDEGRELFRHEDQRSSADLRQTGIGFGYTARVPLKGLALGLYVLTVEARSRANKSLVVSRDVQLQIVP
jgi:hypothetical protein